MQKLAASLPATVEKVRSLLQKLSPFATVIAPPQPKFEDFAVDKILSTGAFDMQAAQASAGW